MSPTSIQSSIAVLLALLVVLDFAEAGPKYSGKCVYEGYAPGRVNNVQRSKAVKPAKFESSILQDGLSYFNTGSGVTAATLGMIDAIGDIMKAAPQISAAIGIVTVGLGFLAESPSPDDILDRAFKSVELLSDEVNLMMDQMQDYADAKDLQLEKNLMRNEYRELFDKWTGCVKEHSVDEGIACQRRAVEALRASRYHFQNLNEQFDRTKTNSRGERKPLYNPNFDYRSSAATWQWMNKHCGSLMECLSHDQVKRLEIGIIPFRDYATLHLFALKTLEATYRAQPLNTNKQACSYYKRYLNEMKEAAEKYEQFAKWSYEWTYIRQYEENDFFGVSGRAQGRPATAFRGGFMGTRECSGGKCTIECSQIFKDNTCTATGGSDYDLKEALFKKCETYIGEVKKQVKLFWDNNVLGLAEDWKRYAEDAKAKLKTVTCSES